MRGRRSTKTPIDRAKVFRAACTRSGFTRTELDQILADWHQPDAPAPETPKLPGSFDAHDWARGFVAIVKWKPSIATDEETMVTWFASALMSGYDHAHRKYAREAAGDGEEDGAK